MKRVTDTSRNCMRCGNKVDNKLSVKCRALNFDVVKETEQILTILYIGLICVDNMKQGREKLLLLYINRNECFFVWLISVSVSNHLNVTLVSCSMYERKMLLTKKNARFSFPAITMHTF